MFEEMLGAFMAPYGSDFALWGGGGVWKSPILLSYLLFPGGDDMSFSSYFPQV